MSTPKAVSPFDFPSSEVTELLLAWNDGDPGALEKILSIAACELRRLARSQLAQERSDHTLQPTALVNELYLRLARSGRVRWKSRAHFFAAATTSMRRILVDHARKRKAEKRGGAVSLRAVDVLGEGLAVRERHTVDLIALDEALNRLQAIEPRQRLVVELRFFAGLSIEETAEVLRLAPRTIKKDWTLARAWLYHALKGG